MDAMDGDTPLVSNGTSSGRLAARQAAVGLPTDLIAKVLHHLEEDFCRSCECGDVNVFCPVCPDERVMGSPIAPMAYVAKSWRDAVQQSVTHIHARLSRDFGDNERDLWSRAFARFDRCTSVAVRFCGFESALQTADATMSAILSPILALPSASPCASRLTTLRLWRCPVSPPAEALAQLASLFELDLRRGNFKVMEFPAGAEGSPHPLAKLATLDLSFCQHLEEVPRAVGALPSLRTLQVGGCTSLRQLPLSRLTGLETLNMHHCARASAEVSNMGPMPSLTSFNMSSFSENRTGLPRALTGMARRPDSAEWVKAGEPSPLRDLNLSGLPETVPVSDFISSFPGLTSLSLCHAHRWDGRLEFIARLPGLTYLDISNSQAHGLPEIIGTAYALQELKLEACHVLGPSLPDCIGSLTDLCRLDLTYCDQLTELPRTLSKLVKLRELKLKHCQALTALPEGMEALSSLTKLNLKGCRLVTHVPPAVGSLPQLTSLGLGSCAAFASLAPALTSCGRLRTLVIDNCLCKESQLGAIGSLTQLTRLSLKRCYFEELPDSLGQLTGLRTLILCDCVELRRLPDSVGSLANLEDLKVYGSRDLERLPASMREWRQPVRASFKACNTLYRESLNMLAGMQNLRLEERGNCAFRE